MTKKSVISNFIADLFLNEKDCEEDKKDKKNIYVIKNVIQMEKNAILIILWVQEV